MRERVKERTFFIGVSLMEYYLVVGYDVSSLNNTRLLLGMYLNLESARVRQKTVCGEEWTYSKMNNRTITTPGGSFVTIVTKVRSGDMNRTFLGGLY